MSVFARWLIVVFVLATSGLLPAFAWALPADPCAQDIHERATPDDHCVTSCVCPCCPVRATFGAEPALPALLAPQPDEPPPAAGLAACAGSKAEIFRPPSC